jgi:hypothetical protein
VLEGRKLLYVDRVAARGVIRYTRFRGMPFVVASEDASLYNTDPYCIWGMTKLLGRLMPRSALRALGDTWTQA